MMVLMRTSGYVNIVATVFANAPRRKASSAESATSGTPDGSSALRRLASRSRVRSEEWSYSDFLANRTHMWLRQRLATNGSVIDEVVLVR